MEILLIFLSEAWLQFIYVSDLKKETEYYLIVVNLEKDEDFKRGKNNKWCARWWKAWGAGAA